MVRASCHPGRRRLHPLSAGVGAGGDCQCLRFSVARHRSAFSLLASDVGGKLGLCLLMLSFMFRASPKSPTVLRGKFAQSEVYAEPNLHSELWRT